MSGGQASARRAAASRVEMPREGDGKCADIQSARCHSHIFWQRTLQFAYIC